MFCWKTGCFWERGQWYVTCVFAVHIFSGFHGNSKYTGTEVPDHVRRVLRVYDGEQTLPAHGPKQTLIEQGGEKKSKQNSFLCLRKVCFVLCLLSEKKPQHISRKKKKRKEKTNNNKHLFSFSWLDPRQFSPAAGPPWAWS